MIVYYLIDDKKYLDGYLLRKKLGVTKDVLRGFLKKYPDEGVWTIQNRNLYPVDKLIEYARQQIEKSAL